MRGGSPTIYMTRVTVTDVVREYWMTLKDLIPVEPGPPDPEKGYRIPIETIAGAVSYHFQAITPDQVRAALRYWREHREEIQREIEDEEITYIEARRKYSRLQ